MSDDDNAGRDDAPIAHAKDIDPDGALFEETVTIRRPAADLYAFWKNPENLVGVMENVVSIERIDDARSRWTVKAPAGRDVSWVSCIKNDEPNYALTWQSEDDADVANSGRIEFADAGTRGTVVRATISYDPPGGTVGQMVAKLFQREPRIQTRRDLRRFKQLMECGEIATAARNRRMHEEQYGTDKLLGAKEEETTL